MAEPSYSTASFWAQANALFRKNLTFQKRNMKANIRLICFPIILCVIFVVMQTLVDIEQDKPKFQCGCTCIDTNGDGQFEKVCGVEYSSLDQVASCPIASPPEWPPLLQIPAPEYRAVSTNSFTSGDLPKES